MKSLISLPRQAAWLGMILCLPFGTAFADETNSPTTQALATQPAANSEGQAPAASTPAKLPYGVEDVLKLTRAQINDDIILNYIHNSGTIYNLSPQDIVYLRNQGVPDRVVNAMLDQKKKVTQVAAQAAPAPVTPAPAIPDSASVPNAPAVAAPDYSQVAPQPAPPASSVYVIPPPAVNYPYYYPYYGYSGYYGPYYGPYYRGYYGYGPAISFGFHFGGGSHWHGGGGHGHGGWHH